MMGPSFHTSTNRTPEPSQRKAQGGCLITTKDLKDKAKWKEKNKEVVEETKKGAEEEKVPAEYEEGNKHYAQEEEEQEKEDKVNTNWEKSENGVTAGDPFQWF